MSVLNPPSVSDVELSAYVDGEAAPERKQLIETWLARNPAQAAKVRGWRRQNQALRLAMGRILCEPTPTPLMNVPRRKAKAGGKITPLYAGPAESKAPRDWDRRDLLALVSAGSFLAGAGVACLAGYLMG